MSRKSKNEARLKRHRRVRKNIAGTADRPRLNVYRSLSDIYVQVIDDEQGHTLVATSSLDKALAGALKGKSKSEQAALVGEEIGKRSVEKGIFDVVFDRGGYRYIGRVKALADGARKGGLKF